MGNDSEHASSINEANLFNYNQRSPSRQNDDQIDIHPGLPQINLDETEPLAMSSEDALIENREVFSPLRRYPRRNYFGQAA